MRDWAKQNKARVQGEAVSSQCSLSDMEPGLPSMLQILNTFRMAFLVDLLSANEGTCQIAQVAQSNSPNFQGRNTWN